MHFGNYGRNFKFTQLRKRTVFRCARRAIKADYSEKKSMCPSLVNLGPGAFESRLRPSHNPRLGISMAAEGQQDRTAQGVHTGETANLEKEEGVENGLPSAASAKSGALWDLTFIHKSSMKSLDNGAGGALRRMAS
jgi:hypothetical protein